MSGHHRDDSRHHRIHRKKHVQEIFDKLGVETRGAAIVRALEVLNLPVPGKYKS